MLGIFLIYYIGKTFYKLAEKFNKHAWGFAVLGVVSYYLGTIIAGLTAGIFAGIYMIEIPDIVAMFITLPFGIFACWGFYSLLKKQWSKKPKMNEVLLDQ